MPTRSTTVLGEYVEYSLSNSSYSGNPFDLVARATFSHSSSGDSITTGMFYAGNNTWKFRFTATRAGSWSFSTSSSDGDLGGHTGTVNASSSSGKPGFVGKSGSTWIRTGTGKAFVPQFVMAAGPHYYFNNQSRINSAVSTFINQHGFTGLHVPVFCRWFDLNQSACNSVSSTNPDQDTFAALEDLISTIYDAGGTVHLWAWGDSSRRQNPDFLPSESGQNGTADRRLQRYIAARLGPLPGWTMGYGFDLFEWTNGSKLADWRNRLRSEMGWDHYLGARSSKNQLDQLSEAMDYSGYEQHQPDYAKYVETITRRSSKPSFSEDRFRYRGNSQRSKDYTFVEMRRGMWHSAMAGGVANIWGNLTDGSNNYLTAINDGVEPSRSFPDIAWVKTNSRFFEDRFVTGMQRCSYGSGSVRCLRAPQNGPIYFYAEGVSSISVNLPSDSNSYSVKAVRTTASYSESSLATVGPGSQSISLPSSSDWAVIVAPGSGSGGSNDPPDEVPPAAPENLQLSIP
ncbi:MAG: DUF5060 domain-containing protein [Pseudomonadales bacterium]